MEGGYCKYWTKLHFYFFFISDDTDVVSEKENCQNITISEDDIPKSIVQWQVDYNYKSEQDRLNIPTDPIEW